jgi:hypothetical protein
VSVVRARSLVGIVLAELPKGHLGAFPTERSHLAAKGPLLFYSHPPYSLATS